MTDRYADANPEEFVTVVGVGPMTLLIQFRRGAIASPGKVRGVQVWKAFA